MVAVDGYGITVDSRLSARICYRRQSALRSYKFGVTEILQAPPSRKLREKGGAPAVSGNQLLNDESDHSAPRGAA